MTIGEVEPRLLTRAEALHHCNGVDPRALGVWPLPFRPRLWDRWALDAAMRQQREDEAIGIPLGLIERAPPVCKLVAASPRALSKRMRASLQKCLRGKTAGSSWFDLVGYSLAELRAHLEARFTDGMAWENMGGWHIDHIRPLATFKITGRDCPEFKAAWALSNLQPLWAVDNLRKGAKWRP